MEGSSSCGFEAVRRFLEADTRSCGVAEVATVEAIVKAGRGFCGKEEVEGEF